MKVGMYGGDGDGSGIGDGLKVPVGTNGLGVSAFVLLPSENREATKLRILTTSRRAIRLFSFAVDRLLFMRNLFLKHK
jgi:hypothetical protein